VTGRATVLRNIALGLDPDAARELMEAAALIEGQEKVMDDVTALWVDIGHPMLLTAAQELREARAVLAQAQS